MKENYNILIIDDEPANIFLMEMILTMAGYVVLKADSGQKALHIMKRTLPDLVLLDVMMPGMDGLEVLRRIKNNPVMRNSPVVMVTASGNNFHQEESIRLGASFFMSKPFVEKEVLNIVNKILGHINV